MTERASQGAEKMLQDMHMQSMRASLEARRDREKEILEKMEVLFKEVDGIIPQLPQISGEEPITEAQRSAQHAVKERLHLFAELQHSFLLENTNPTNLDDKLEYSIALTRNTHKALQALMEGGAMTAKEHEKWVIEIAERAQRVASFFHRYLAISDTHNEQLYRV